LKFSQWWKLKILMPCNYQHFNFPDIILLCFTGHSVNKPWILKIYYWLHQCFPETLTTISKTTWCHSPEHNLKCIFFPHTHRAASWYYQSFFIHQLVHTRIVLKTILKCTLKLTLKQPLHVSVQSPSSGSTLFELAKVTVVKIIN
jgi:hypothetical protein